ncbi:MULTISPECIES: hypothetical protein [Bacillus amyloliquefaciens group]|uniref:hypothetical protein n=1 Tax=Bacillus amyloliquefaciens group TaxID=1938374 RepID=UPI000DEB0389|nr:MULTISPECIES: hypothetical protein [Bacillus amyloliquefaciens group]MCP9020106.1 hypothetical protein [Bacillus velezensis]MDE5154223.1 hypothetical protein [Bacillus amyloliquefaciens]QTG83485.1 hypothetical protein J4048_10920 [Bacillus amyloliquefaciens]RBZ00018.1 hypothetical protein DSD26_11065 [Bacillus velezensis]
MNYTAKAFVILFIFISITSCSNPEDNKASSSLTKDYEQLKKENKKQSEQINRLKEDLKKAKTSQESNDTKDTDTPIAPVKKNLNYKNKLDIYFIASKFTDATEGEMPGVFLQIKNNGDKTITFLEITVYFKDESGSIIAKDKIYPINFMNGEMYQDFDLKPGEEWQLPKNDFIKEKNVPDTWVDGNATYEVTDIKLEE